MKRRRFIQTLAVASIAPAALAQQPATSGNAPPRSTEEAAQVEYTVADGAAEMTPRFFTREQFAALRKLSDILMPAMDGRPGALDARAPEFLDFLIGVSEPERQQVYRAGLDALNAQATKRFHKSFAELDDAQAGELLAPLRQSWTYEPPADPLARFLREAKQDVRAATINSREYATAGSTGGRRGGGIGQYWYPIE